MRALLALFALTSCSLPAGDGAPIDSAHFTQTGGGTSVAAPGDLELEFDYDHHPGETLATGVGLVLGLPRRNELSVAWSPYAVMSRPGRDARKSGDVSFSLRNQLVAPSRTTPSWVIELGTHLAVGEAGHTRGEGAFDLYIATAAAQSYGPNTYTGYYELLLLETTGNDATLAEHVAALEWARRIQPELTAYAEGIGVLSPAADLSGTYLGTGVAWHLHPRWNLEAGVLFGLGGDAEDFRLLIGLTTLLANLTR
jgi:hypothetical protein